MPFFFFFLQSTEYALRQVKMFRDMLVDKRVFEARILQIVDVSGTELVIWHFVIDRSGAGADFLRELRFPLPIYISSASPQSSSLSPEAGTIGQE
jgi:hypothetical protein